MESGDGKGHQLDPSSSKQRAADDCVVCLEPVSERAIAVPCNHYCFDFICLVSWLQESSKCPLCKTELTAVEYDWSSPDDYKTFRVPSNPQTQQDQDNRQRTNNRRRFYTSNIRRGRRRFGQHHQPRQTTPDAALSRRRYVYRNQLYSLHVGSNRLSRFKDFTPHTFARDAELQSRARKWIRRELQVFDFLSPTTADVYDPPTSNSRRPNNTEFLLEYIVAILRTVDIKSSTGKAQEKLGEFLGEENANLFLHELEAWLRSPYSSLEDWDRAVQYRKRLPAFVPEGVDTSTLQQSKEFQNRERRQASDTEISRSSSALNPG